MKRKYFLVGLFLIIVMFLSGCSGIGTTPPVTINHSLKASFTAVTTTAEVGPEVSPLCSPL